MIVPKPSVTAQPSFVIRGHTLEKNLISVRIVEKLSARAHLLQNIRRLTLEKNPTHVRNVEKPSARVPPFLNIRKLILEEKPRTMNKTLVNIQLWANKREFILDKNHVLNNVLDDYQTYCGVGATKNFCPVLQKSY